MTDPVDVAQRREAYHRDGLRRHDLDADPMVVFEAWYREWLATGPYDGTAVVVATADASGRPSARFVLLKGYDERGFVFYTNGSSRKGVELHDNPQAALCFGFIPLNRQIRVVGDVEPVSAAESDAYFASRPRASQENAWASAQSSRAAGWSRIAGNFPLSSHAWKKNCQSMYSRSVASSGSTTRRPVNSGTGRSSN